MKLSDQLNALNTSFYQTIALDFSQTRQQSWPGWDWLITTDNIRDRESLSIVDLACGNGRFARFLLDREQIIDTYLGIDATATLLQEAARTLQPPITTLQLQVVDLLKQENDVLLALPPKALQASDLVVAFGFWHHLSTLSQRLTFLKLCRSFLKPDGSFWLSTWEFINNPTLLARKSTLEDAGISKSATDEWNPKVDYILDWRRNTQAYRYCHHSSLTEIESLVSQVGLSITATYKPQRGPDVDNRYYILKPAL